MRRRGALHAEAHLLLSKRSAVLGQTVVVSTVSCCQTSTPSRIVTSNAKRASPENVEKTKSWGMEGAR